MAPPWPYPYNRAVSRRLYASPSAPWVRLAAFLGFLAVLAALAAPASMLAQEVRSGQLGGVCGVSAMVGGNAGPGSGEAPQAGSHCDMCGALGWALPSLAVAAIPCFAGHHVAAPGAPAILSSAVAGLPFSRGPPLLLS